MTTAVKRFPNSWRFRDSVWIIRTDWSVKEVRDYIKLNLEAADRLLVLELSGDGSWAGLDDDAIKWLMENL